jgi:hypothetical protein
MRGTVPGIAVSRIYLDNVDHSTAYSEQMFVCFSGNQPPKKF